MSSSNWTQDPHKLLVIPGPIEFTDDVLLANAHPSMSHVSPAFAPVFANCMRLLRKLLYSSPSSGSLPILVAGSGTLGWDAVASNLIERPTTEGGETRQEKALVLNSGYFGDSFSECLEVYGAEVTQLRAPVGGAPTKEQITEALKRDKYKLLTFTHVDTSTGVLANAKMISDIVREVSPETLIIADCVCSVASEEIRFDDWGLDVVISATQKGLGAPPGLSVVMASKRALEVFEKRKTKPTSYFISWGKWVPVMRNYEAGTPSYFATPPVQLIYAFEAALKAIMEGKVSLEERLKLNREASQRVKAAVQELGLGQIPLSAEASANGMTAVKYPSGIKATDLLPKMLAKDIVIAAGLHKEVKDTYFRIGHMGTSVVDAGRGDLDHVIEGLKASLKEAGYTGPGK